MKIFSAGLLLTASLLLGASVQEPHPTIIKINSGQYIIWDYNRKQLSQQMIMRFHKLFSGTLEKKCSYYNVKKPETYTVNLCVNPSSFITHTGQPWLSAGIFDRERKQFFFKNPHILIKRGILERVISHEVMFLVISLARQENTESVETYPPGETVWIEESFCQALYPADKTRSIPFCSIAKKFNDFGELKNYLAVNLISQNRQARINAYGTAGTWGMILLTNLGERKFFEMAAGIPDQNIAIDIFNRSKKGCSAVQSRKPRT
jgi:hypothetical protein